LHSVPERPYDKVAAEVTRDSEVGDLQPASAGPATRELTE
jgi:hypothetical protein